MENNFTATYTIIPGKLYFDEQKRVFKLYGDRYISAEDIQEFKNRRFGAKYCLRFKMNGRWNDVLYYTLDYKYRAIEVDYALDKFILDGKAYKELDKTGYFTDASKELRKAVKKIQKKYTPAPQPTTSTTTPYVSPNLFEEFKEKPGLIACAAAAFIFALLLFI